MFNSVQYASIHRAPDHGYLRRNLNEGLDTDGSGYDFWLKKLNQFNGDYQKSEMVKAFRDSTEYRSRLALKVAAA